MADGRLKIAAPGVRSLSASDGERAGVRCAASSSTLNPVKGRGPHGALRPQPPVAPKQGEGGSTLNRLKGLRVCFLAGTLGQGGAERQLFYTLKCLKECGAKVDLLCLTKGEYWEKPISNLGVAIHYVGGTSSRLGRLLQIVRVIRRLRPQVVQCQHFYTSIYGAVAGRCLGIPSIGAVRSDGFWELKTNGRFWFKLSLILPHWMAANSERAIGNLRSLGYNPEKFLLLPNVVDMDWFRPVVRSRSENEFFILGVGSLERAKRFDRLLEIAADLQGRTNRVIRVVIAGDGTQRDSLEALAEQTRRKGVKVDMVGRVRDPLKLYQSADVLLLASDREGTPNVVMEAMACGLPVVATNVGGVADLIGNGETGFLFEPGDTAGALVPLERLACEPALAAEIGQRARAFIEKHHSVSLLPEILAGLYEKVLSLKPQRFK
jgi:glycosyltransferase involved in cell wall biosynthesis